MNHDALTRLTFATFRRCWSWNIAAATCSQPFTIVARYRRRQSGWNKKKVLLLAIAIITMNNKFHIHHIQLMLSIYYTYRTRPGCATSLLTISRFRVLFIVNSVARKLFLALIIINIAAAFLILIEILWLSPRCALIFLHAPPHLMPLWLLNF